MGRKDRRKGGERMRKSDLKNLTLQEQANELLAQAEEKGLQTNFFFRTTFKRYLTQIRILDDLEKAIQEHGATVTKEYVKGRQNLVANPAITEYNKTSTAANGTVSTLINIIKTLSEESGGSKLRSLLDEIDG